MHQKSARCMKVKVKSLSRVRLFATPSTIAYQAPRSMGFSRQECWSGLPFSSPGNLPDPGIEPRSPTLQANALPSEPPGKLENVVQFSSVQSLSRVLLFVTPCTIAYEAPTSMEFSFLTFPKSSCVCQWLRHIRLFATPWSI